MKTETKTTTPGTIRLFTLLFLAPVLFRLEEAKLVPPDGAPHDEFGSSVALVARTALVGAPRDDDHGENSGSVYVYERSGTSWSLQQKLTAAGASPGDLFGTSVALVDDLALVGAPLDDHAASDAGMVYVFLESGGTWERQARLVAGDPALNDRFGTSLSIHGDTALIGAPGKSGNSGAVYVFVRQGTSWIQQAKLQASDSTSDDCFGGAVTLHSDRAVVGAAGHLSETGAAYVFERSGSSWSEVKRLIAGDSAVWNRFGHSVSLFGEKVLVGAPGDGAGAAYVFLGSGPSWAEEAKLVSGVLSGGDEFGCSVSLEGDVALIGARRHDVSPTLNESGSAFVFERFGSTWQENQRVRAPDAGSYDRLGHSVALAGFRALIGAPAGAPSWDPGACYVFSGAVPGRGFCFGDPGSGTPCPCDNDNDGTIPGSGCDNGVFSCGAQLAGRGGASVSSDTLVLSATNMEPYKSGMYLQGSDDHALGAPWGDGLKCVRGEVVRLQARTADGGGRSETTIPLAAAGSVAPGETRYYQAWYRTTVFPPCGYGVNNFNSTNGYAVTWEP